LRRAGSSIEEVRDLIAEAIGFHIDLMKQSGERIPRPSRRLQLRIDDLEEGELCAAVEVRMPQLV
jgi:predicted RNase H-like HicB family nuclease